jgi:glyoxylase-like metal-dependent hydrolase (beta-lactamase superfamily II)
MRVETFPIGPLQTNCYVASEGNLAVVVDPGGDPRSVIRYLDTQDLTLSHILLTHLHCDHLYGVEALRKATKVMVMAGRDDQDLLQTELGGGGFMGLPRVEHFDYEFVESGVTTFMAQRCLVLHTPGHSAGSMSYYFEEGSCVFVGDLIFEGSIGRTDFPGGNLDVLRRSVLDKIFTLPEDTVIYPGHGPATTVGREKAHNPYFNEFY